MGNFYTTRPPEMAQKIVTRARVTNENIEQTIDYNMSYEDKKVKKFPVINRSKSAKNVNFELFWVIITQHDLLKWPKNWSNGPE